VFMCCSCLYFCVRTWHSWFLWVWLFIWMIVLHWTVLKPPSCVVSCLVSIQLISSLNTSSMTVLHKILASVFSTSSMTVLPKILASPVDTSGMIILRKILKSLVNTSGMLFCPKSWHRQLTPWVWSFSVKS